MNDEINYQNNPLHGLGLKKLLTEIVDQYGFRLLYAYLNINCFKTNPSIESSVKFLKKTEWARQKVEVFYLYEYKNLPRASSEQFALPPRDRIIPEDQKPGEPAELSLEDAERLREKRERKAAERKAERSRDGGYGSAKHKSPKRDNIYTNNRSYGAEQNEYEPATTSDTSTHDSDTPKESVDPWAKWK